MTSEDWIRTNVGKIAKRNGLSLGCEPKKLVSGRINQVYDLGDAILKIENDNRDWWGIFEPQVKLLPELLGVGAKVPEIIDSGKLEDGRGFLLMKKIKGRNLGYIWKKLTRDQRGKIFDQLAEQLRIFHSLSFDDYAINIYLGKNFPNFSEALEAVTYFNQIDHFNLDYEMSLAFDSAKYFYENKREILENSGKSVLVHNDIHLQNILFDGEKITGIIDFDWVCQAPADYELWKMINYFHDPDHYVIEEGLKKDFDHIMREEMNLLKKYYPELFEIEDLADRIRLYLLRNFTFWMKKYQKDPNDKKLRLMTLANARDFYQSDWLDEFIS